KEADKRQKLVELFTQERQARKAATLKIVGPMTLQLDTAKGLATLQTRFYADLVVVSKETGEVEKITQMYLDRLKQYVKEHPNNDDVPDAMVQIIRVYESQGSREQAGTWRDRLLKEHPQSTAAKRLRWRCVGRWGGSTPPRESSSVNSSVRRAAA